MRDIENKFRVSRSILQEILDDLEQPKKSSIEVASGLGAVMALISTMKPETKKIEENEETENDLERRVVVLENKINSLLHQLEMEKAFYEKYNENAGFNEQ